MGEQVSFRSLLSEAIAINIPNDGCLAGFNSRGGLDLRTGKKLQELDIKLSDLPIKK